MKKIYLIISTIGLVLILTACGSGGTRDGITDEDTIAGDKGNEITVVNCNTNTTTPILEGDTLVSETDDTTVTITDTNGDKTVCVDTGAAHLLR